MPRGRSKNSARAQVQQASPVQLRRVAISALKPAPYNSRVDLTPGHPTLEELRCSIDTFATVEPIVWNRRTGHVVGGHQRLSVLKHLGHTHVDVVVVDLDLPQEKTLNLALNRIVGEWDEGKLAELLKDLIADPTLDLGLTGFDSDEIDHVLANLTTTDGLANDDAAFDVAANLQAAMEATWVKHGAFVHCQIIWAKNRPVLTRTWYSWQHEPCLMGWIQGNKPHRAERNVLSTVWHIDTITTGTLVAMG